MEGMDKDSTSIRIRERSRVGKSSQAKVPRISEVISFGPKPIYLPSTQENFDFHAWSSVKTIAT